MKDEESDPDIEDEYSEAMQSQHESLREAIAKSEKAIEKY